ncbi:hypothetical protein A2U10_06100 [Fusobacterium necrophorum subsp. funduliforme]|nr:hypothetical protein BWX37_06470 [Fusobacterium necrophorum subsp. funduliforme]KYL00002.1 hypothetical protein A2J06_06030 [Fusobacterium necrophorum subsp. funduliforme]KYL01610.1 hypothetical protein A2J05_03690 [Fusobacterium necrophorum subsp. funduliforme]KYM38920.1 hypothetical protein A2U10_06100 [Fusobacterium necrophorum subsp. funduliforme]KYM41236.1 hypothetical protein A2U03_03140 [Fusobacterium necrophorum subsp. funduliforme]
MRSQTYITFSYYHLLFYSISSWKDKKCNYITIKKEFLGYNEKKEAKLRSFLCESMDRFILLYINNNKEV